MYDRDTNGYGTFTAQLSHVMIASLSTTLLRNNITQRAMTLGSGFPQSSQRRKNTRKRGYEPSVDVVILDKLHPPELNSLP